MGTVESTLTESHVKIDEAPAKHPELRTVPQHMEYFARELPDKEAVVFLSTDGSRDAVTFKELYENSKRVAGGLLNLGIKRQDVVAINLRTCPEWLYITFGSMMAAAIPFSVSFTYKDGSDLIAIMEQLKTCPCLVLDPGYENETWNIVSHLLDSHSLSGNVRSKKLPSLQFLLCHDQQNALSDVKTLDQLLNSGHEVTLPEIHYDDIAALFQTSGSTGMPKMVSNSHRSLLMFTNMDTSIYSIDDIYLNDRPFGWMGGFPLGLFIGQTRVTLTGLCRPPPDRATFLIEMVRREGCNIIVGLPSTLQKILDRKDELGDNFPIKIGITGGQPITKHTISCLRQLCRYIMISYGGTEMMLTSANIITHPDTFIEHSCGPVVPGKEVKVVDMRGDIVPVNTSGEIYIKSRSIFSGYYNDPELTTAAFTQDGWFKSDDIGRMLEDGSLIVEGRKSNMIISGGMNVAPEILEKLLQSCPGVESCVIVPVPDDAMYQVICACVKVVPGSNVDEAAVRRFCEAAHSDKLGLFTVLPKYYIFMDSFPETNTGKVSRKELADIAEKTFQK